MVIPNSFVRSFEMNNTNGLLHITPTCFVVAKHIVSVRNELPKMKWKWEPTFRYIVIYCSDGSKNKIYCKDVELANSVYQNIIDLMSKKNLTTE